MPLISLIAPGKNEGGNIFKLVKSLNEQTYQNVEIIIVLEKLKLTKSMKSCKVSDSLFIIIKIFLPNNERVLIIVKSYEVCCAKSLCM